MTRSVTFLSLILLATGPLLAQVVSTPSVTIAEQTFTTGMVGVVASQTAQLNVLNLSQGSTTGSTTTTTTAANTCSVQMAFYDSQNRLIKQSSVVTVAAGSSVSLSFSRAEIPAAIATTPRVQIRGVVTTQPVSTASSSTAVVVISATPFVPACSLVTTLELFDVATGVTQMFTSDARAVSSSLVTQLTAVITNK